MAKERAIPAAMSGDLEAIELIEDGVVLLTLHTNGVAHLALNRPESSNGLSIEMLSALSAALMRVHGDSRVRVVLITGGGKNFCAGGDVHAFLAEGDRLPAHVRVATAHLQNATAAMIHMNAPVVAAVQGFAAGGGGMGIVCSSDFVIAGESTRFLAGATRVAMVPDAGVSVTLTHLVGLRKATEILMLNPVIGAAEARQIGLVTRVVADADIVDEAWRLSCELAAGAPAALSATKRLLWSGLGRSVEAAMPDENAMQAWLCGMKDAQEGLTAVIEKRAPRFTGT